MKKMINMVLMLILTVCVTLMSGCAGLENYQFGNLSKAYCASTDVVFREGVKTTMATQGIRLGLDYCTAHGMVDAMSKMATTMNGKE